MKKLVALILAAVMCVGMLSTVSYAGEAQEGYKVGVILYDINCQWAKDIMGCLRSIGEPLGVTFEEAIGGAVPSPVDMEEVGVDGIGEVAVDDIAMPRRAAMACLIVGSSRCSWVS